jgi:Tol biopolymer transport system component
MRKSARTKQRTKRQTAPSGKTAAVKLPKRLTHHPGADIAVGWTPDGKHVLFNSDRNSPADGGRLFTVAVDGVFPEEIPLPIAEEGSYSPDGSHMAYVPLFQYEAERQEFPTALALAERAQAIAHRLSDDAIALPGRLPRVNLDRAPRASGTHFTAHSPGSRSVPAPGSRAAAVLSYFDS